MNINISELDLLKDNLLKNGLSIEKFTAYYNLNNIYKSDSSLAYTVSNGKITDLKIWRSDISKLILSEMPSIKRISISFNKSLKSPQIKKFYNLEVIYLYWNPVKKLFYLIFRILKSFIFLLINF